MYCVPSIGAKFPGASPKNSDFPMSHIILCSSMCFFLHSFKQFFYFYYPSLHLRLTLVY